MQSVVLGVTVFDGYGPETAKSGAKLRRDALLPVAPFPGLELALEGDFFVMERVVWVASEMQLACHLSNTFMQRSMSGACENSFADWLQTLEKAGWDSSRPFEVSPDYWRE